MRNRLLAIATGLALLPLLAGAARADIALVNQTDTKLTFTITPYAAPGQEVMAVICGQVEVSAGTSDNLPANPSCGERATIGAATAPDVRGWSATCRSENLSWTDGRIAVTGSQKGIACGP